MNNVCIVGRLTKDINLRYTQNNLAFARFNLAINRGKDKDGNDKGADFPSVVVFGRQAENCDKYLKKGRLVGIQGRIQTGSYKNKNGDTVYTTEVVANNVEFLEWGDDKNERKEEDIPEGFAQLEDEDIPF